MLFDGLQKKLREYAELIALGGAHIKKGDYVIIYCETSAASFAETLAECCYIHGAAYVDIQWKNSRLEHLNAQYADDEHLYAFHKWQHERLSHEAQLLPVTIRLVSTESEDYDKSGMERQQQASKIFNLSAKPYKDALNNKHKWTVAGAATPGWAWKVYPGLPDAVERLWNDIFTACNITGDGTALSKWKARTDSIEQHRDTLNSLHLKSLHFKTGLGTDIEAHLPHNSRFAGGSNAELNYHPNIPTEEIFTSPDKTTVNGILAASTPLCLNGQIIEGLVLTVKNGKVTKVNADTGEEYFRQFIQTDEGASMFGELAVVDRNSGVNSIGHIMYCTLFDENASCHAAVGRGFATTLNDYTGLTHEEVIARGINDSAVHCDIMFGTDDTEIYGINEKGETVTLMKDGLWQV